MMTPDRPKSMTPDPAMFAPVTASENNVLRTHLTSGWYKQNAVFPVLSDIWQDTADILDDLHTAWDSAFDAEQRARATCQSCGASGSAVPLDKITVRSLADGAKHDEWQCTDREACVARFAPDAARLADAVTAGGAP